MNVFVEVRAEEDRALINVSQIAIIAKDRNGDASLTLKNGMKIKLTTRYSALREQLYEISKMKENY